MQARGADVDEVITGTRRQKNKLRWKVVKDIASLLTAGTAFEDLASSSTCSQEEQPAFAAMAAWVQANLAAVWVDDLLPLPSPSTEMKDLWPVLRLLHHMQQVRSCFGLAAGAGPFVAVRHVSMRPSRVNIHQPGLLLSQYKHTPCLCVQGLSHRRVPCMVPRLKKSVRMVDIATIQWLQLTRSKTHVVKTDGGSPSTLLRLWQAGGGIKLRPFCKLQPGSTEEAGAWQFSGMVRTDGVTAQVRTRWYPWKVDATTGGGGWCSVQSAHPYARVTQRPPSSPPPHPHPSPDCRPWPRAPRSCRPGFHLRWGAERVMPCPRRYVAASTAEPPSCRGGPGGGGGHAAAWQEPLRVLCVQGRRGGAARRCQGAADGARVRTSPTDPPPLPGPCPQAPDPQALALYRFTLRSFPRGAPATRCSLQWLPPPRAMLVVSIALSTRDRRRLPLGAGGLPVECTFR